MVKGLRQRSGLAWFCACAESCMVFNTGPYTVLPDNSTLNTANMQSETGFTSSHQLKSYVATKSRLKLAARAVLSADAGLLVSVRFRTWATLWTDVTHLWPTSEMFSRWKNKTSSTIITQVCTGTSSNDETADIVRISEVDCPPWMFIYISSARLCSRSIVSSEACHLVAICTDLIGRLV